MYPRTCSISLKGLVRQITQKYTESRKVQTELEKYGIFLLDDLRTFRCEDPKSPFCGDTTPRLI